MTALAKDAPDASALGVAGACLIVDLVGFSKLCAELTRGAGRRGADRVSQVVRSTLEPLIEGIAAGGGAAFDMAGDSVLAAWPGVDGVSPAAALRRAEATAERLFASLALDPSGHGVAARIAIGFGAFAVSPPGPRRRPLVGGEALGLALKAMARAEPGRLAVEGAAWTADPERAGRPGPATPPELRAALAFGADGAASADGETRTATVVSVSLANCEEAATLGLVELARRLDAARAALSPLADIVDAAHLDDKGLTVKAVFGLGRGGGAAASEAETALRGATTLSSPSIGVATGRLFAGALGGGGPRLLFGAPLVLSTRLMESAAGRTHLDEPSAERLREAGRIIRPLDPLRVKGEARPVEAFALRGKTEEDRDEPSAPPLIGREAETAALSAFLDAGPRRRGLVIEAGPGVGKSALLAHAAELARDRGLRAIVLRPAPGAAVATARQWSKALGVDPAATARGDAEAADAVVAALAGRPTILCVDDAQWLDEISRRAILRAFRATPDIALVAAVERREEAGVGDWLRTVLLGAPERLTPPPLDVDGARMLLETLLGVEAMDEGELSAFHAMCGGSPAAMLELGPIWRASLTRAGLRSSQRALRRDLDEIDLPLTLSEAIERRVGRLEPEHRRILKAASAIGERFPADLVATVSGASDAAVGAALSAAQAERLVGPDAAGGGFAFQTHGVWNVVYGMMSEAAAREAHRALARVLVRRLSGAERDAALAFHLTRAGAERAALRFLPRVGAQALAAGAPRAALRAYGRALDTADRTAREGRPLIGPARRAALRAGAARAALALGDLALSLDHCERGVRELSGPGGRPARLAAALRVGWTTLSAALGAAPPRPARPDAAALAKGRLHALSTDARYFRGEAGGMIASAALALDALERGGGSAEAARSASTLAYAAALAGLDGAARRLLRARLERLAGAGEHGARAYLDGARALVDLVAGRTGAAAEAARAGLRAAEASGDTYLIGIERTVLGLILQCRGAHAEAAETFDRLAREARASAADQHLAWGLYASVSARLRLGDATDAADRLDEARRLTALLDDMHSTLNIETVAAALALRRGDEAEALSLARAAAGMARRAPTNNFGSMEGFFGGAETLAALACRADGARRRELAGEARGALDAAGRFARRFRFARPRLLLLRGVSALLDGDARGSARLLARAVAEGEVCELREEPATARRLAAAIGGGSRTPPSSRDFDRAVEAFATTGRLA